MLLSIKIVTTNGITRQFYQSDSNISQELIDKLKANGNIFSSPSLVLSSDLQTEIFSPKFIVSVELEYEQNTSIPIDNADFYFQALDNESDVFSFDIDAENEQKLESGLDVLRRVRVEFYFVGGHKIITELNITSDEFVRAERINRVARLFEQTVICYRTANAGIGFLNPYRLTRAIVTPRALALPADAIIVDDY